ncbi:hypothetical protein [Clostridium magnum]|nr:hypothetical protein [Clostridium magnum]
MTIIEQICKITKCIDTLGFNTNKNAEGLQSSAFFLIGLLIQN